LPFNVGKTKSRACEFMGQGKHRSIAKYSYGLFKDTRNAKYEA